MDYKNLIPMYIKFEDEICNIGSQLDGQNFYDLIDWDEYDSGRRLVKMIPRIGEIVEMDSIWFEVIGVKHKPSLTPLWGSVHILLKQIPLEDSRTKW
jgi:hypothetical protein